MKIIEAPKSLRDLEQHEITVRIPKDFPWKLLEKLIIDLGRMHKVQASRLPSSSFTSLLNELTAAVRRRDVKNLLDCAAVLSPRSMLSARDIEYDEFFILYQLGSLLKKYPFPGADTATPALRTFLKFEKVCDLYNRENYKALVAMSEKHPDYLGIIEEIREDIRRCIGDVPNVQRVYDCAQHGPGTALGLDGSLGCVTNYYSWLPPYCVTPACRPYAKQAICSYPQWIGALQNWYRETLGIPMYRPISMDDFWDTVLVEENCCKYASVPKTAETDRSIAIEPVLNVYLQLGVDRIIRSRLKRRWGYDLNSQELNQKLALDGSKDNESCTIDLKGASETVTLMLCMMLLPEGWYDLMCDLRSPNVSIDGTCMPLAKMSAMGNGFTFALESLIFAALVRAAKRRTQAKGSTAVYGDDLVVPKKSVGYLISLLNLCGFTVNEEKSFVDGPFRESCGKDYYRGQFVRPFFLKTIPEHAGHIFYIHNSLKELEDALPWAWDVGFPKTRAWLHKYVPRILRGVSGPKSESRDTHMWSEKRIHRIANGIKVHPVLLVRAKTYNRETDFFFRKLMVSHKPAPPRSPWEEITMTNTGSAFDVTRRGRTRWYVSVRQVW